MMTGSGRVMVHSDAGAGMVRAARCWRMMIGAICLLCACASLQAQPRVSAPPDSCGVLIGRVTDTSGMPVIGATIRLGGTKRVGYSKAPDGRFRVEGVRPGACSLVVGAVGYAARTIEQTRIISGDSVQLLVVLEVSEIPPHLSVSFIGCLLPQTVLLHYGRAETQRALSGTDISERPRASLHEALGTTSSIRWFDPAGGPR